MDLRNIHTGTFFDEVCTTANLAVPSNYFYYSCRFVSTGVTDFLKSISFLTTTAAGGLLSFLGQSEFVMAFPSKDLGYNFNKTSFEPFATIANIAALGGCKYFYTNAK